MKRMGAYAAAAPTANNLSSTWIFFWVALHTRRDEESSSLQLYLGAHSTQLNDSLEQVGEVGALN